MTSKPETVLKQIEQLDCKDHSKIFLEFYDWLTEDQDNSARNASTYLKILRMFSISVGNKDLGKSSKMTLLDF